MEKKRFLFYTSWKKNIDMMDDIELRRFINNLIDYTEDRPINLPTRIEQMIWNDVVEVLNHNETKRQATVEKRRLAGLKGGAPVGNTNAQKKTNVNETIKNNQMVEKQSKQPEESKELREECKEIKEGSKELKEKSNMLNEERNMLIDKIKEKFETSQFVNLLTLLVNNSLFEIKEKEKLLKYENHILTRGPELETYFETIKN
jgi:hypothetical protein